MDDDSLLLLEIDPDAFILISSSDYSLDSPVEVFPDDVSDLSDDEVIYQKTISLDKPSKDVKPTFEDGSEHGNEKNAKRRKIETESEECDWIIEDYDKDFDQIGPFLFFNGFFCDLRTAKIIPDPMRRIPKVSADSRSRIISALKSKKRIGIPRFKVTVNMDVFYEKCTLKINLGQLAVIAKPVLIYCYREEGTLKMTSRKPKKGIKYTSEELFPIAQHGYKTVFLKHDPFIIKPKIRYNDGITYYQNSLPKHKQTRGRKQKQS